jgi:alpha-amylase
MANPWNGKVVLETFWWNCWNGNFPFDWYTFLAKLAPRLAAMGFDGIWTPPPCKDTNAQSNMGYTPYDYYDIGQKDQRGAIGTRFGTMDSFLRLVAVAHANGLEVYPDIVLDHCAGGAPDLSSPFQSGSQQFTSFHPNGYAGAGTGRWPRNWLDFHFNPQHWQPTGDWTPSAANSFGADFCYQGRCSDSGNANPNCAARSNARAWLTWFVKQTGVDGFRFDDVDGYPPEVVEDLLYNAMGSGLDYFAVGEYVTGSQSTVDAWANATLNRCGTFDYPLR